MIKMIIKIHDDKLVIIGHASTTMTCSALTGMIQAFRFTHPLYSELVEEEPEKGVSEQFVVLYRNEKTAPNYDMIRNYLIFLNEENKDYEIEYV